MSIASIAALAPTGKGENEARRAGILVARGRSGSTPPLLPRIGLSHGTAAVDRQIKVVQRRSAWINKVPSMLNLLFFNSTDALNSRRKHFHVLYNPSRLDVTKAGYLCLLCSFRVFCETLFISGVYIHFWERPGSKIMSTEDTEIPRKTRNPCQRR